MGAFELALETDIQEIEIGAEDQPVREFYRLEDSLLS